MKNPPKITPFLSVFLLIIFTFQPFRYLKTNISINSAPSSIDLINEVNNLRITNGLSPYSIDQRLMSIAQSHSDYQASIGTVTHYGSDGSRPYQRALNAGYPVAGDTSLGGFFSENIAAGRNLTVSGVVQSWQQDSPHLNTMLSSTYQDIGAGVSVVDDVVYYTIDVGLASGSTVTYPVDNTQDPDAYYPATINQIVTSTPQPDGRIIHSVKIGETLWTISQVYGVSVDEILLLNNKTSDYIFVGDELLISEGATPTPTQEIKPTQSISHATNTMELTSTLGYTSTPTVVKQEISDSQEDLNSGNNWYLSIPIILFIAALLFILIRIMKSHKVK